MTIFNVQTQSKIDSLPEVYELKEGQKYIAFVSKGQMPQVVAALNYKWFESNDIDLMFIAIDPGDELTAEQKQQIQGFLKEQEHVLSA